MTFLRPGTPPPSMAIVSAADKNVPITTRRVSEGTQCITGWSLAHASGWYILIRRSPSDGWPSRSAGSRSDKMLHGTSKVPHDNVIQQDAPSGTQMVTLDP